MSQIKLTADSGGGTTSLKAPSSTTSNADVVLKLPVADGSSGQVLKTDGSGQLSFTSNAGTTINNNADNRVITGSGTANTLEGESNIHINGGTLIAGHTASTTTSNGEGPFIQVKAPDSRAGASFIRHSADAAGSGLYIGKSRNATIGSNTVVQDDDELGRITFSGDDGTDINTMGAEIAAHVDGTPGSNDMPGRLTFRTTADGAASTTERMRIDSAGNVGIGLTSPETKLHVQPTHASGLVDALTLSTNSYSSNGGPMISFKTTHWNYPTWKFAEIAGVYNGGSWGGGLVFRCNNGGSAAGLGEKLRIQHGGGISFNGDTATANALSDYEEGTFTVNYKTGNAGGNTVSAAVYTSTGGVYTKIGDMVHFQLRIKCSSHTAVGGQIIIEGLPFTQGESTIVSGAYTTLGAALGSTPAYLHIDGTEIRFQTQANANYGSGAGGVNLNEQFHCAGTYKTT